MSAAIDVIKTNLNQTLDASAEQVFYEFPMSNIERTFAADNKSYWSNIADALVLRTNRLNKLSGFQLQAQNEKQLLVVKRAIEIAQMRSNYGHGLIELESDSMRNVKKFYTSLFMLCGNLKDNPVVMNIVTSCISILCKMIYLHENADKVDALELIRRAIGDVNCSDRLSHDEKQVWLICTQRLNKKLQKYSGSFFNPPALRLV